MRKQGKLRKYSDKLFLASIRKRFAMDRFYSYFINQRKVL